MEHTDNIDYWPHNSMEAKLSYDRATLRQSKRLKHKRVADYLADLNSYKVGRTPRIFFEDYPPYKRLKPCGKQIKKLIDRYPYYLKSRSAFFKTK